MNMQNLLGSLVISASLTCFGSAAMAADGSCLANYSKQVGAPGQFKAHGWYIAYHTIPALGGQGAHLGTWPEGQQPPLPFINAQGRAIPVQYTSVQRFLDVKAFPTAYRPNFTSGTRETVWTIPAGENSSWWTRKALRNYPGTAPVRSGSGYSVNSHYSQAEMDAGLYVGTWAVSKMPPDSDTSHLTPDLHPDPQQHAIRYVIGRPYGPLLDSWSFTHSPDVNVPDASVRSAAIANSDTLTAATIDRLKQYIANGSVSRNYLDLKPGTTILNDVITFNGSTWRMVSQGRVQEDCSVFAEIIKHPRLADVYMLKYFIRTAAIRGLAPFLVHQNVQTFIAYAPYAITTNQVPELRDDAASTNYRTPVTFNVLVNDVDPDEGPEPLKVIAVESPAQGSLTWLPDGTVTYTPAGEWMGEVVLDYTATDGGAEETAKLRITVNDAGLEPVAGNDVFVTTWDKPITLQPLSNDVVPDMGAISITAIGAPTRGSAMIASDRQSIRYIPVSGLTGSFSFPYTISDTKKTSSASITVIVREPEQNRSDWDAKPFNYEDWCRSTVDGKPRQGGYSDDCWKMMRDTKPVPN